MKTVFESESDSFDVTKRHFLESLRFPMMAVLVIWLVHAYQVFAGWDAGSYGIISRRLYGFWGIVTGPLVHGSWQHLISNTFPLFVLLVIMLYFYRKVALRAFWVIYFLTGISVWVLARPVSHIGASGVVYGMVAFIFWNGVFRRSLRSIMLALIVLVLYSGMFMGVLPDQEGISWESHLLGSLSGIFTSFWFKRELEDDEMERNEDPFADERYAEKQFFIPGDAFDKTKTQRALEAEEPRRRQEQQDNTFFPPFWNQNRTW